MLQPLQMSRNRIVSSPEPTPAIFSMTKKRVKPDMYALSTLIFGAMFVLLILMNVAQSRSDKKQRKKQREVNE